MAGLGVLVLLITLATRGDGAPEVAATTSPASSPPVVSTSTITSTTVSTVTNEPEGAFVTITPAMDAAAVVAAQPEGTRFVFEPGVYRHVSIAPRSDQVFEAKQGVVFSGAKVLTDFAFDGNRWFVDGQTQQEWDHGECFASNPRCRHPEDLFLDGELQTHVSTLQAVGPGSWFFDYNADRIYLGSDPEGSVVETSVTRHAFSSDADRVEIRGFIIQRYANQAQHGVIDSRLDNRTDSARGDGWVVESNVIRQNHGTGIVVTDHGIVRNNEIIENGQLGITAYGLDVEVTENTIAGNNTTGFDYGWEAGGSKFKRTTGLVVQANVVRDNFGPGLWTDIDNVDSTIENNVVQNNAYIGIFHEISYSAVIRDNIVEGNGFHYTVDVWGAGITVAASPDVEVTGNIVRGNAGGIVAIQQNRSDAPASFGPVEIENLRVYDNIVEMNDGFTGLRQEVGDNSYYRSRNNVFEANDFVVDGQDRFYWNNRPISLAEWLNLGLS